MNIYHIVLHIGIFRLSYFDEIEIWIYPQAIKKETVQAENIVIINSASVNLTILNDRLIY